LNNNSLLPPREGVKLIDVGDFAANQKIIKDSMFKNIATGFKKTRLQIRQKATLGGQVTVDPDTMSGVPRSPSRNGSNYIYEVTSPAHQRKH